MRAWAAWTWSDPQRCLLVPLLRFRPFSLLRHGTFSVLIIGPVCSSFSTAITPPCRSWDYLEGAPSCSELQRQKCLDGNTPTASGLPSSRSLLPSMESSSGSRTPWGSCFWKQRCWTAVAARSYEKILALTTADLGPCVNELGFAPNPSSPSSRPFAAGGHANAAKPYTPSSPNLNLGSCANFA